MMIGISQSDDKEKGMSIKKIAEKVGVSTATVSRVLNNPNYHCSTPDVRDRIWQAAIDMNYVPNEAAKNLKQGVSAKSKTYCIQILMTRTDSSQADPFFRELLHILETEIHRHMCILVDIQYISEFSDDKKCRTVNKKQAVQEVYDKTGGKCDGLIIIGKCNQEILQELRKKYIHVVSVNRNSTNYEVDEVLCDGRKVAAMAVEYLVELGHRKIGYVGDCHNEARYRGFLDVLHKYDIDLVPEYVIETKQTEKEGYQAMETFLKQEQGPTGIYCANDITAIGMLKYIQKRKQYSLLRPSIVASDDIEAAQEMSALLTTVRLPKEEMGKFALYLLLDRIRGGHTGVARIEVEGKLIKRRSCSPYNSGEWTDYCI